MPDLNLHEDYSREDVHDIFSPATPFHPQTGTWGLLGILSIPNRSGDFVFFVTFGQKQGDHVFDEEITGDGVLSWQSQPSQDLKHPIIRRLIDHNDLENSVYLFLRTAGRRPYTYLGPLIYLEHDVEREGPVYFKWQLKHWPIPHDVMSGMNLTFAAGRTARPSTSRPAGIAVTDPPSPRRAGTTTDNFRRPTVAIFEVDASSNKKLGNAGESLVARFERDSLIAAGRRDLAEMVRHVAQEEGDGAGYDVLSYTPIGEPKYIEVKTTRGGARTSFYISSNEISFSTSHAESYFLYRLFDFEEDRSAMYILSGRIDEQLSLCPVNYRASIA